MTASVQMLPREVPRYTFAGRRIKLLHPAPVSLTPVDSEMSPMLEAIANYLATLP